jgi:Holliday junction resolvase
VKEAYDQSRLKQMIVEFLRDRVFLGAKRQVEQTAVGKPSHGNLKVTSVDQVRAEPSEPTIEVKMERREIITVSSTDAELIEEFMQRFGSRN